MEIDIFWTCVPNTTADIAELFHIILLHEYVAGSRPQGRPRKMWIDNIIEDWSCLEMTSIDATRSAEDRNQYTTCTASERGSNLRCQDIKSSQGRAHFYCTCNTSSDVVIMSSLQACREIHVIYAIKAFTPFAISHQSLVATLTSLQYAFWHCAGVLSTPQKHHVFCLDRPTIVESLLF